MVKVPIWAYYCMNSCVQPEQDPPVYYSIVILTILYYLRVADLMGITSSYPRENIIAGNYILADMSDAVMHKAKSYVDNWEETKRNHIGCLFWGPVGTWKSFIAGCIANELLKQEVTVKMSNFNTIIDDRGTGGTISFY